MKLTPSCSLILATLAISSSSSSLAAPTDNQGVITSHDSEPLQGRQLDATVQQVAQAVKNVADTVSQTGAGALGAIHARQVDDANADDEESKDDSPTDESSEQSALAADTQGDQPPAPMVDTPIQPDARKRNEEASGQPAETYNGPIVDEPLPAGR